MPWILLCVAGLLEMGWAIGLKYTDGFTRLVPSVLTVAAIIASMLLLARGPVDPHRHGLRGLGGHQRLGAACLGMLLFHEPATPARLFFLGLLLVAIVGLKVTGQSPP